MPGQGRAVLSADQASSSVMGARVRWFTLPFQLHQSL